jgi:hypothetical protein
MKGFTACHSKLTDADTRNPSHMHTKPKDSFPPPSTYNYNKSTNLRAIIYVQSISDYTLIIINPHFLDDDSLKVYVGRPMTLAIRVRVKLTQAPRVRPSQS